MLDALPPKLFDLRTAFRRHGFDLRLVGGAVRDFVGGIRPKDVDLATDATPDEQVNIYQGFGLVDGDHDRASHGDRFLRTGLQHGTITVVLDHVAYEITSLRTDHDHDGRHATVAFTRDWVTDLARRDLTINSMAMTFDGDLVDPFGGRADLENRIVRFVGDAEARIREDYLRILRWFRFHGRIAGGQDLHGPTAEAVRAHAAGLQNISAERIWSEISKIIVMDHGPAMMQAIHDLEVGLHIMGDVGAHIAFLEQVHRDTRHPVTLMTAFLGDDALKVAKKWKWSNEETGLAAYLTDTSAPFVRLDDLLVRLVALPRAHRRDWVEQLALYTSQPFAAGVVRTWQPPKFPVNGDDLLAAGMKPGPAIASKLRGLWENWVDSGFTLDRDALLQKV